jgi:hypothetical protein
VRDGEDDRGERGIRQTTFEAVAAETDPPAVVALDTSHVKAHHSVGGGNGGEPSSGLARLSTGWSHPVDKKSLQIQKLEHILVARIYSI